jgi:GxxExxY protein
MNSDTTSKKYDLGGQIIGCAMEVHREMGHGFNENVYKNSLAIELQDKGFTVELEKQIKVYYKGHVVGNYAADVYVNELIILELKAIRALAPEHEVQLVNYLTATGVNDGLLINFGAKSLEFKKKYKDYKPPTSN